MPEAYDEGVPPELTEPGSNLLRLTGLLFDAAGDENLWPRFLRAFCADFGSFASQLMYLDKRAMDVSISCLVGLSREIVESFGQRYRELAVYDDLRSPYALQSRRHPAHGKFTPEEIQSFRNGRASHCRMLVDDDTWHATSMYREVCQPAGIEYGLTIVRDLTNEWSLNVALMRGPEDDPYTPLDCRRLEAWLPHIERAVGIHSRLERSSHDLDVAFTVLDELNVGVLLVDDMLDLKFANRVARRLLGRGDGIRASEHRLQLVDRAAHRQLASAAKLQAANSAETSSQPIVVHGQGLEPAYSLLVTPVWECLRRDVAASRPGAVVFVTPCQQRHHIDTSMLEIMWKLTRAEVRVVRHILSGASVMQAAATLGVTDNTVRKHLKAVFSKTGTRSQADLVRSVAGTTAWFVSPGIARGHGSDLPS